MVAETERHHEDYQTFQEPAKAQTWFFDGVDEEV